LSYSPQQVVVTFAERAVTPVVFAELAAKYPPQKVREQNSGVIAANGQYILVRRAAYDAVGGYAAVGTELLEDVALARLFRNKGKHVYFRYAGDAVRTRMYRNWSQLREGWTKNLALLFLSPKRLAALRAIEFVLILSSFAITIASAIRGRWQPAVITVVLCGIVYALFLTRIRRAHFSWDANLLALFGLPLFSYLLLRSARAHANGSVPWKGRTYSDERCLLATGH